MMRGACAGSRFLIATLLALVTLAGTSWSEDNLEYHFTSKLEPGKAQLSLAASYLEPGSEIILLDGLTLPPESYRIDPVLGRLELMPDFPGGQLEIRARLRPFRLPRLQVLSPMKSWRDLAGRTQIEIDRHPLAKRTENADPKQGELQMMGSKSLVLRLGNGEDMAVEQSLRLSLQGQVADSVFVEAMLRDDDLPFQAEGNTERLEELDKVVLRVIGPAGHAEMGDFVFQTSRRELTPFQRDFQGLAATWSGERGESSVWLAQSRGVFTSQEFYGEEGLQGPYELLSALRASGAVILAGSERVFLNGSPLTRGRERDYVIDYDRGSVTFGSKRPVSASDRIRVDYRYSLEAWRRTAWGTGAAFRLAGLRLDFLHFDESDDPENPLAFPLDDDRRAALEAAGDSEDLALTDGILETPGTGHYVWVDSLAPDAPAHFVWVDSLGDYELRFRELGAGQGDYQAAGIGSGGQRIYQWVGPAQGSFALGEKLALPESYRLETLRLDWERAGWVLDAEVALSDFDANALSTLNDDDNWGLAYQVGLTGVWDGPLTRDARLSLRAEFLDAGFRFPGARRGRHEYREWNLEEGPPNSDEELASLDLSWGEIKTGGLNFGAEALRFGTRYEGLREFLEVGLPLGTRLISARSRQLQSRDESLGQGSGEDTSLRLTGPGGWIPDLWIQRRSARREIADSLDLSRAPEQRANSIHDQAELRLHGARFANWELAWGEESIRADEDRDQVSRLRASLAGMTLLGGRMSLGGHYRQRRGFIEKEQFLAEGRIVWPQFGEGWHGQGLYRLGSRQQRLRESRLIFVGFGAGDLNEEGVFVGEGEGEYRLMSLPAEESARTRNLEIEASLMHEPALKGPWLGRLASETRLILVEESRNAEISDLLLLRADTFRREGSTLLGELKLEQELRYIFGSGWRLRYRGELSERHDERFTNGARISRRIFHQFRTRRGGNLGELILKAFDEINERVDESSQGGGSYEVRARGLEAETSVGLGDRLSAGMRTGLRWQRDRSRELEVQNFILEPRLSLSPVKLIRLEVSYELTQSRYSVGDPSLGRPWFFDAEGWKRVLRIEGRAQAGSHLTFSVLYELREEEDRDRLQRLRLESRAFF